MRLLTGLRGSTRRRPAVPRSATPAGCAGPRHRRPAARSPRAGRRRPTARRRPAPGVVLHRRTPPGRAVAGRGRVRVGLAGRVLVGHRRAHAGQGAPTAGSPAADALGGTIAIVRQRLNIGGKAQEDTPKSDAGERTIALDAGTVEALRAHRQQQRTGGRTRSPDGSCLPRPARRAPAPPAPAQQRAAAAAARRARRRGAGEPGIPRRHPPHLRPVAGECGPTAGRRTPWKRRGAGWAEPGQPLRSRAAAPASSPVRSR